MNFLIRIFYRSKVSRGLPYFFSLEFNMPKYAVARGKKIGVYDSWDECKKQIEGFAGAKYKKFETVKLAEDFIKEYSGSYPVSSNEKMCTRSAVNVVENDFLDDPFPVAKISPSNTAISDIYKNIRVLETKMAGFMKQVNSAFDDIKKRLTALEEKKVIEDQYLRLSNENKEIESKSNQQGVKRKGVDVDEVLDLSDDDFINLNYDDDKNVNKEEQSTSPVRNTDIESKQKKSKLEKCKILDEADGYYGVNQCIVNNQGFLVNPFGAVVAYTDGACSRNGRAGAKAGIGVWFNHNHPSNVSAPVRGRATNNNAEIQAATAAVMQASREGIRHLHIYTDSQFLINCITTWIYKWKRNDWKTVEGRPVINKVELVELDNCINEYMDSVVWTYVKGHSGDVGNTAADELACRGAILYGSVL